VRPLAALALLSAATLAFELALLRAFSLSLWHHFAYMVIAIALLGFGASGTFLSLWPGAREQPARCFAFFSLAFALSIPASFWLANRIPFDPALVLWDPRQWLALAGYYVALFVPFFFAATAVGLWLAAEPRDAPRVYAFNLLGSGLGSLALVLSLYLVSVERAVLLVYVLAATAALLVVVALPRRLAAAGVALLTAVFYLGFATDTLAVRVSAYKSLSLALQLPQAEMLARRYSPLGEVDVLRSPALRYAPGLSLAARATPPPQLGLFIDGESAGAITAFDGRRQAIAFLDWTSAAAPYHLATDRHPRVLVLGAGGGSDVLLALYHSAARVDAVELNPQVVALVRDTFGDFSGRLYDRADVRVHLAEARHFAAASPEATRAAYDVIQLSSSESLAASAAGVRALNENYLLTREAFDAYLDLLGDNGVLAATRWLKSPPRDELKLFATAVQALEAHGVARPGEHLALVRSWATATLIVKRTPFTPAEIAALQSFCEERLFDLDYYPGARAEESNRFNRLQQSYYFEAAREILAGGDPRAAFFASYPFDARPARDDRPYFEHTFRWRALPLLLRTYGRQWLPFLEWGYLVLVLTLIQAAVLSLAFILLPLLALRRRAPIPTAARGPSRARVLLYFAAIGFGFLFLEIVYIQRLTLFLGHPVKAAAVVLTGILVFSALGSWAAGRWSHPLIPSVVCALTAAAAVFGPLLTRDLVPGFATPLPLGIELTLAVLGPTALLMGMPFPSAWRQLGSARPDLLPWAWSVNGCASVLATGLATLLAMSFGLSMVFYSAAALYALAALAAARFEAFRAPISTP
jgi:spermidine synthase